VATLLADSPPAPSDELNTPDASGNAPPAPSNGAAPAPAAPAESSTPAPAARACARCDASMAPGQDWCLQCGAGAPGSIGTPSWRSAATVLTATAVLAVGAAAAAYAALSKGTPAARMATTTVARAAAPTATAPQAAIPNPLGSATTTTQPLIRAKAKPPKIPLIAAKIPQKTTSTLTKTGGSKTITTPTGSNTGGGTEPKPEAIVLDTNAASTYNPYNYPASGFGDPSLAIDGDTSTAWNAQVDPAKAPSMAEGILIDLKAQQKLAALQLVTSSPGMTVQVYGTSSQTAPTSITDPAWAPLSRSRAVKKKHAHIVLKHSTKAFNFITLWISKAPASSTPEAPGHVSVNELELLPAA
jgi:hypothetical protein